MRKFATFLLALALACGLALPGRAQYTINPFAPTYSVAGLTVMAGSQSDVVCVEGPASGAARVLYVYVSGFGGGGLITVSLIKRSSLDTGGTSSTITPGNRDSTSPASTVTVRAWTANPTTLGTQVAQLDFQMAFLARSDDRYPFPAQFSFLNGQPLTLNGPTEALCINLLATANNGDTLAWSFVLQQSG
jgi:hypothetical protein